MHSDRVKHLQALDINQLLIDIFGRPVEKKDIGNHDDLRNFVCSIEDKYIFKAFSNKNGWKREVQNLVRATKSLFSLPEIIDFGMVGNIGWIVMTVVNGENLAATYNNMPSIEKRQLWYTVGQLLANFHNNNAISSCEANFLSVKLHGAARKTYLEHVKELYFYHRGMIVDNDYYGNEEAYMSVFSVIEAWLAKNNGTDNLLTLCHHDFSLRNILYDASLKKFGLIDFEMGFYTEAESDFTRLLLDLIPQGYDDDFFNGYFKESVIITRDDKNIYVYLLLKLVEICSWSFVRANDHYTDAFTLLRGIAKMYSG